MTENPQAAAERLIEAWESEADSIDKSTVNLPPQECSHRWDRATGLRRCARELRAALATPAATLTGAEFLATVPPITDSDTIEALLALESPAAAPPAEQAGSTPLPDRRWVQYLESESMRRGISVVEMLDIEIAASREIDAMMKEWKGRRYWIEPSLFSGRDGQWWITDGRAGAANRVTELWDDNPDLGDEHYWPSREAAVAFLCELVKSKGTHEHQANHPRNLPEVRRARREARRKLRRLVVVPVRHI